MGLLLQDIFCKSTKDGRLRHASIVALLTQSSGASLKKESTTHSLDYLVHLHWCVTTVFVCTQL